MRVLLAILMLTLIATTQSSGREPGATTPKPIEVSERAEAGGSGLPPGAIEANAITSTFLTLDITIDPQGQALGAYQFELTSEDTSFTVVGVEAGEHAAFDHGRPPYFDPIAKQGETDRLVLAEYAKPELKADGLPTQAVRVATVHIMFTGPRPEHDHPSIRLNLVTAGNAEGEPIDAKASYSFRTPERP